MKNFLLILTFLLVTTSLALAQRVVTGTVVDDKTSEPLPGANVIIPGTNTGATVDSKGAFSITVPNSANSLLVSFIGYTPQEVGLNGSSSLAVRLVSAGNLDELVVVGYSAEKKRDLKGAVAVIKVSDALKENNANLLTSLQGRIAGLDVSTDGAPGSGVTLTLRGLGSFNNNTPPLFIVDGVPTYDINGLSPNDIESFQVLKDAASAAIYGARGSSGVVVITTKKGKSGSARVSLNAFYGIKTLRNKVDMLNASEYGQALWQGFKNDGVAYNDPIYGTGTTPTIPAFLDDNKTTRSGDTDWIKEAFQPASNYALNFDVSKAADKSNFYFGVNYNKEEGLLKTTFYDRLTLRLNSSFQVGNRLTIGQNLSVGYLRGNRENEGRVLEAAVVQLPIVPLKDNAGNWAGPFSSLGDYRNPLGDLNRYKNNISKGLRTFGNVYAEIELLNGLSYRSSFAVDNVSSGLKFFENRYVMGRFSSTMNQLSQTENKSTNLTATNTLNYAQVFGKHDVNVIAGYEWIHNKSSNMFAVANNFFVEDPNYIYLSAGTPLTNGGGGAEYGLIGQFAKVNYGYDSRYLFSASLRRDGSSRFGSANRYGVFPAVSAAWRISDEPFFKGVPNVSDLKLRASWGQNGNDNIKNYNYASFYGPSIDFNNYDVFGQNSVSNWQGATGFAVASLGNPLTKWEAVEQTNLGLDLGLFNDQLIVTADYYVKTSRDLLYQVQLPATVGEGTRPFVNVGSIRNQGLEMLVSYRGANQGKLKYNVDFTLTSNKNQVLSVGADGNDVQYPGPHIIKKGLGIAEFFGYINDGIFKSQSEVDAHAKQDGKGVGMLRFRDVNGDGVVNAEDRTALGSPLPKLTLGLNSNFTYGNFDLNLFFDSKIGNKIWDQSLWHLNFLGYTANHSKAILNAWTPTNVDATIPILTNNNANFNKQNSSYFLSDGSYVRLKNIVIGYNLPAPLLKRIKLSQVRVYAQAQNLLTLTGFKGYDFETLNGDLGSLGVTSLSQYPHSKAFTLGFTTNF